MPQRCCVAYLNGFDGGLGAGGRGGANGSPIGGDGFFADAAGACGGFVAGGCALDAVAGFAGFLESDAELAGDGTAFVEDEVDVDFDADDDGSVRFFGALGGAYVTPHFVAISFA